MVINIEEGIAYDQDYYYVWLPDDLSTLVRLSRSQKIKFHQRKT